MLTTWLVGRTLLLVFIPVLLCTSRYGEGGCSFPAQGMGSVRRKSTFPGGEAAGCHRELLQVLPYPKDRQKRGRHKPALNKQEPLISEKVSRQ